MARKKVRIPREPVTVQITSLNHEGKGVSRIEGKTVFVTGALPGETVECVITRKHRNFDEAQTQSVLTESPLRITPRCKHFSICGGCSMQHLSSEEQIKHKQQVLIDNLERIGKVSAQEILPPLTAASWGYRKKARLGVRYVPKKGRVLVGFRERNSHFLADLEQCEVLIPEVGTRLIELGDLIYSLSCKTAIPQIEVAADDQHVALVFRHLEELTVQDIEKLKEYGSETGFYIYLQPKGPDTIHAIYPESDPQLRYELPEYNVYYNFMPSDFTQVNSELNRKMVKRSVELLGLEPGDRLLELFCGLGNFTLAMARFAESIVAVEGEKSLIERARENAKQQGFGNVDFHVANLMEDISGLPWLKQKYNKIFLDPPRSGALEIIPFIGKSGAQTVLYVSCDPATLARDAGILVNEYGYTLTSAGVMDMFPQTGHVESIALFEKR